MESDNIEYEDDTSISSQNLSTDSGHRVKYKNCGLNRTEQLRAGASNSR